MKKFSFVVLVLAIGAISFTGCDNSTDGGGGSGATSTLTITNTPAGAAFSALVSQSRTAPTTKSEYDSMITSASTIAFGSGTSPFPLIWTDSVRSGTFLIMAYTGTDIRFTLASFNNGNTTVNWASMTQISTLP